MQYLDENKSLILKIVESQNLGKLSECAEYVIASLIFILKFFAFPLVRGGINAANCLTFGMLVS